MSIATDPTSAARELLRDRFEEVRCASLAMCKPLKPEDFRIQPIAEVSPPWWNLGHTSWFFARNVLQPFGAGYGRDDEQVDFVLNSYYASLGNRLARDRRGLVTRPTTREILRYRQSVDQRIEDLLWSCPEEKFREFERLLTIGIQHEQQHQELFYTEIKFILAQNPVPFRAAYREDIATERGAADGEEPRFVDFRGGLLEFGNLEGGWCWDNELPVHKYYLRDFRLRDRLVTNGEYLEFIADGGYRQQLLWLDNGWAWAQRQGWQAPLYWEKLDNRWMLWTLGGMRELDLAEPVCHVSFYEADAFARWKGASGRSHQGVRLPTEREWEHAARTLRVEPGQGNFLDHGLLHPRPARGDGPVRQMLGDVWEWTASYYEPYPGYEPFPGVLAEYNGKFMDNQRVLRGGSCATPANHVRISYRNFWAAETRFQFTGIRLAQDA